METGFAAPSLIAGRVVEKAPEVIPWITATINYERLEKDVMNMGPQHFSEIRYFYDGAKRTLVIKVEYLQFGKGNCWCTSYYYDGKGRLKKRGKIIQEWTDGL